MATGGVHAFRVLHHDADCTQHYPPHAQGEFNSNFVFITDYGIMFYSRRNMIYPSQNMMHSKRNMLCFPEQSTSYVILTGYSELGTDYSERIKLY